MKIVHVTTVPETLRFFTGQISYMKQRGAGVHVVSSPGELLTRFGLDEGIPVHAVPMHRRITPIRDCIGVAAMVKLFRDLHPEVVHGHTPKGGLLAMVAACIARVPVRIFHLHGLPHTTASPMRRVLLWWATKVSCYLADHVLSVSASVRDAVISECICKPCHIDVLMNGSSNGIDADGRFCPARISAQERAVIRQHYNIPPDATVLGFVGRLVRDKGLLDLATAFDQLQLVYPSLHILLVGNFEVHDPVPEVVEAFYRTNPRVHITGWLADVTPLYTLMDFLVLPSYREGFPNALLEAAAMEVPVIATDVVGCRDAVVHGVTGQLVPPGDPAALRRAIGLYIEQPELRVEHARAGRMRALRDYSPAPLWNALLEVYKKLLQNRARRGQLWERHLKRMLDLALALVALLLLAPLMAAVAVIVRLSLGTPILFRQERPGRNGCAFTMLKFRTMREVCDADGQPLPDRDRLTVLGCRLRKWSLDELPALWNVVRGEMSLVGPRPLLMRYLPYYTEQERLRFSVQPGITGWAQIQGRNFSPWDKRFADDIWYVQNWSLLLDLKILWMTLSRVLRAEGVAPDSYVAVGALDEERSSLHP